ncbi:hypothetical protein CDG61_07000 [Acinetobacter sp. WCHAc010052]|nr:hypothetical protein CDG61_07000 [Acinetobacter sp. WCHAc010052]
MILHVAKKLGLLYISFVEANVTKMLRLNVERLLLNLLFMCLLCTVFNNTVYKRAALAKA